MDITLNSILTSSSLLFALIGFYMVIRVWTIWRKLDIETIRGRVFLNKKFLERNWKYVFLTGAAVTLHQFIVLAWSSNLISINGPMWVLSEILETLSLVFLVILAYEWFKVLNLKK